MKYWPTALTEPITPMEAIAARNGLSEFISTELERVCWLWAYVHLLVFNEDGTARMKREDEDIFDETNFENLQMTTESLRELCVEAIRTPRGKEYKSWLIRLANKLPHCDVVLWKRDLYYAAVGGAEVFAGLPLPEDSWAVRPQFWVRNWANPWLPFEDYKIKEGRGVELFHFVLPDAENHQIEYGTLYLTHVDGKRIPYIYTEGWIEEGDTLSADYTVTNMTALSEFLKLKIAVREQHQFARHERRQLQRENISEPIVNVIQLRRPEYHKSDGERDVDWSHRWMVKGHWRKQWYSSEGIHKPIYVHSFIKGPDNKPFKAPKESVFVVNR